jgi:hypothetical protein
MFEVARSLFADSSTHHHLVEVIEMRCIEAKGSLDVIIDAGGSIPGSAKPGWASITMNDS